MVKLLTPELRFPEFNDDWRVEKLGDIAQFSKGANISKNDTSEDGLIEVIRYGELYTVYSEIIDKTYSKTNLDSKYLVFSKANDVIIPASGESNIDIATASVVLRDGIALGGDINIIRSNNNGAFLAYYLNSVKSNSISKLAQGVSVVHLYPSGLKSLSLYLPSRSEQDKITDFLTSLDQRITYIHKKNELLKKYKKSVMQKIFTQQIRFKDKDGNPYPQWEEKPLSEVAGRVNTRNKDASIKNVLTNSAVRGIVNQSDFFDKDIANQNNLVNYHIVSTNDFVYNPRISVYAPVGPIKRNHLNTGVMSPLYLVFRFKDGSLDFYENYFETKYWHEYMKGVANSGARHDRMNITNSDLYELPLPFPCIEEQHRIAQSLTAIDNKIKSEETKLVGARVFKKVLLQRLFV